MALCQKSVVVVLGRSNGARSGPEIGSKLNIVLKPARQINEVDSLSTF